MSDLTDRAAAAASNLAEGVRELNHATLFAGEFEDPADVYRVLGDLMLMTQRLPQAIEQLARIIDVQRKYGDYGIDDGSPFESVDHAMQVASLGLVAGVPSAQMLYTMFAAAQQALAPVYTTRELTS